MVGKAFDLKPRDSAMAGRQSYPLLVISDNYKRCGFKVKLDRFD